MLRKNNAASNPDTLIPSERILWCKTTNFLVESLPHLFNVVKNSSLLIFLPSTIAPVFDVIYIQEYPLLCNSAQKSVCDVSDTICAVDLAQINILSIDCSSIVDNKFSQSCSHLSLLSSSLCIFLTITLGGYMCPCCTNSGAGISHNTLP